MEALCQVCYIEPAELASMRRPSSGAAWLQRLAVGRGGRREPAVETS